MGCLPCFSKDDDDTDNQPPQSQPAHRNQPSPAATADVTAASSSTGRTFNFRELAMATKNFRQECLLGEGGFGRIFKGTLQSGEVVAVKQLDRNGMQGNKEFIDEVSMLGLLQHPNLVNFIGYCADGDQRLLVYEFMPLGSLEDHLFGESPNAKPMDWCTRMKIAAGAAQGLEYLHEKANPPIVFRDLKPTNVLLDENFDPKLSDFALAKIGSGGGKMNPASRVMGTYGYSAPEYSSGGELTLKSDIYSFGVVLLELITGRRVIDTTRPNDEHNLVTWAHPIFRDPKRFPDLADPRLNKQFPVTSLNQAVGIAAMCLQEEPTVRPLVGDIVGALSFLSSIPPDSTPTSIPNGQPSEFTPPPEQKMNYERQSMHSDEDGSNSDDGSSDESEDESSDEESVDSDRNEEKGSHSGRSSVDHSSDHSSQDDNVDQSEVSSEQGSSQRSSNDEENSSRQRKIVVTFREPK